MKIDRPLALRGHVTNAFLKQLLGTRAIMDPLWLLLGMLLITKIDKAQKNYLTCTPEI